MPSEWEKLSGITTSPPSPILVLCRNIFLRIVFQVAGTGGVFSISRQDTVNVKKIDTTSFRDLFGILSLTIGHLSAPHQIAAKPRRASSCESNLAQVSHFGA
jgi:hypothetical protein